MYDGHASGYRVPVRLKLLISNFLRGPQHQLRILQISAGILLHQIHCSGSSTLTRWKRDAPERARRYCRSNIRTGLGAAPRGLPPGSGSGLRSPCHCKSRTKTGSALTLHPIDRQVETVVNSCGRFQPSPIQTLYMASLIRTELWPRRATRWADLLLTSRGTARGNKCRLS